ncbi:ATP-binding protein [Clostridium estertheticum]|uniref:ATP-binding protein n=1 Tax=Clostridium estertheticum TaxID=238834 RepID=UPI001C0C782C|nr:ATP-binding protein [Clostridium estertheticum]MBU3177647.1 ATP-binding protein [Clostridium estertheticum]
MDNKIEGYIANGDNIANLVANNIYNPISAIGEIDANFYDADGTKVNIELKEEEINNTMYITEIKISGDGTGMDKLALDNLKNIGDSNKKNKLITDKFKRRMLGSFGIASTAFQRLGSTMDIYSKTNSDTMLYKNIIINNDKSCLFSQVKYLEKCSEVNFESGCTFIIRNCRIKKTSLLGIKDGRPSLQKEILKNKLSYLPISKNFKITLCGEKIERFEIDKDAFSINIDGKIDEKNINGTIYIAKEAIKNKHYNGIYLKIDNRIIDWNIYDDIRGKIGTPGSVTAKIHGYIIADELREYINASRDGLTDTYIKESLVEFVKRNIAIINKKAKVYYQETNREQEQETNQQQGQETNREQEQETNQQQGQETNREQEQETNQQRGQEKTITVINISEEKKEKRKEKVEKKIREKNKDLYRLGIKFCYEPENEQEVIVVVSQMCQEDLLDFQIVQLNSKASTDGVVIKTDGTLAFLEFEKTLNNFFEHGHVYTDVDKIVCWDADEEKTRKEIGKYVSRYGMCIESIKFENDYIKFTNKDESIYKIKLYIISKIIKKL